MLKPPVLLLLLFASCLHAQITTGSIVGSVIDPVNLLMPGVTVTLEQTATGARRTVQTNERGDFVFSGIAAGEYRIVIAVEGFKTLERGGINLSSAETLSLSAIALEVGSVSDRITVEAQGAAVQTASAERSGLVTSSQVEQLAIRGRQITSLLQLQPGVVMLSDSESITNNIGVSALGGRNNSNNMSIDGVSINDIGNNNGTSVFIGMDAVAEVKMLVSNYQAEYGRLAGANINLVTKSGTRHFHGSASYFKRHEQFNAANFFNNRLKQPKPRYRYNTWSYNVGGPIYIPGKFNRNRDKLFFFFSQEFWPLKQNLAISQITVPTEPERAGDFSQSLDLNSKLIVVNDPTSGQPFAGNRMPASRIDPNGQALLKMFPAPNFLDINISARRYNYVFQGENNTPKRTETARIDYNISSKDILFGSYTHRYDKQTGYRGLPSSG